MRDIWLCDAEGNLDSRFAPVGLPARVWHRLYPRLGRDRQRPLLRQVWQYHWGAEGDAFTRPEEVARLGEEVASLLAAHRSPEGPELEKADADFFCDLARQVDLARERGAGLRWLAD